MDLQTILFLNIPLIEMDRLAGFVVGIYLGIKEKIAYFPISLVNVIVSILYFYHQSLYSDVVQRAAFILLLSWMVHCWITW